MSYLTWISPRIDRCRSQKYGYTPRWVSSTVAVAPLPTSGWLNLPSRLSGVPDVMVWVMSSWLVKVTLLPAATSMGVLRSSVGFATFLPLYADKVGLKSVGPVLFVYAALVLAIRLVGARLPDRLGYRRASTFALIAVASGAVVLGAWQSTAAVWIAAVTLALGMSLLFPALFSATVHDAPEEERSHAVGTFSLFFDLANGIGPFALGAVVSATSEPTASTFTR